MPIQFKRKVFTSGGSLRVNIPVEITKALEVSESDIFLVSLDYSHIIMENAKKG
jgi:antitoxin component of MazEF toxin-antitoxin module